MNYTGTLCKFRVNPKYSVEFVELSSLIPHEDVEPQRLTRILKDIKFAKYLVKPIIIDSRKRVIIDGHHRLKALSLLGVGCIPAVEADYGRDIVDINSWMYVGFSEKLSYRDVLAFIEAVEALSKRGNSYFIAKLGKYVYKVRVDNVDLYIALKNFISLLNKLNLVKIPMNMSLCLRSDICIAMPKLSVDDIYRVVLRGEVLPPRTTYHITPLKNIRSFYSLKVLEKRG